MAWKAEISDDPFVPASVRDNTGYVAETVMPDCARLIAAAPDLAEALEALRIASLVAAKALRGSGNTTAASYLEQVIGATDAPLRKALLL